MQQDWQHRPVEQIEGMANYSIARILSIAGDMLARHGHITEAKKRVWDYTHIFAYPDYWHVDNLCPLWTEIIPNS